MRLPAFVDIPSIILVGSSLVLFFLLFYKKKDRIMIAVNISMSFVFFVTLVYSVIMLSTLQDIQSMGPGIAFVLLSNIYMTLIKIVEMIVRYMKE